MIQQKIEGILSSYYRGIESVRNSKKAEEIYKLHLQKLDSILTLLETAYWEDNGNSFIEEIDKYQNEVESELKTLEGE
jgi:hypothetical protein